MIVVILIIETTWFTLPRSDFSVKVNDQINRGRQIDKITADTERHTHTQRPSLT